VYTTGRLGWLIKNLILEKEEEDVLPQCSH
jgi:hypothetical protein